MRILALIIFVSFMACREVALKPSGGFSYPTHLNSADTSFSFYPLRDSMSTKDSFYTSYHYLTFQHFHEENFSIRPLPAETYRLCFYRARGETYIVNLTEGMITVKKGFTEEFYTSDDAPLSKEEKIHLSLLERRFPVDTMDKTHGYSRSLDSMVRIYPQLLDKRYFKYLLDKTIIPDSGQIKFSETRIRITKDQYKSLVGDLNSAGFWQSPHNITCRFNDTGGYVYTLEANTQTNYNVIIHDGCPNDTSKLTKACQRILETAKVGNELSLIWDDTMEMVDTTRSK